MARTKRDSQGLPVKTKPKMEGALTFKPGESGWADVTTIMEFMTQEFNFGATITDVCIFALAQIAKGVRSRKPIILMHAPADAGQQQPSSADVARRMLEEDAQADGKQPEPTVTAGKPKKGKKG